MNKLSIALLLVCLSFSAFGQRTIRDTSFYSPSLDETRHLQVYLPDGYSSSSDRYPVVYFLHGGFMSHTDYQSIYNSLDLLLQYGRVSPMIIVKPDGKAGPWELSWWASSELYGDMETYIVEDLVEFIDGAYRTQADPGKRAIMGHSMGGFGAMRLALLYPDKFRGVASLSGGLDLSRWPADWAPSILSENGGSPPYTYNPFAGSWTQAVGFAMAGAFSANLSNSPHQVNFPLDNQGNIVGPVFDMWMEQSPCRLAAQLPQSAELAIYFDCGDADPSGVYPWNMAFADSLDTLGIPHEFQSYSGGHMNQLDGRYNVSLDFLDAAMNQTTGIEDDSRNSPESYLLHQNYPNPFNPSTKIEYELPEPSYINLTVHNVIGQEVATIVAGGRPVGTFRTRWDATGFPSGMYLYRLKAGEFVSTKTMLLVR
jgi:S-formylglutathione hydrolase FrmB